MIGKRLDRVSSIATRLILVSAFDNQTPQMRVSSQSRVESAPYVPGTRGVI
jgi:hypothetical protein